MTETDNQPSVLVVDDVPENRLLMRVILKKTGYKTTLCSNGKEAVELAQKEKFDIILMDIQMAVMDGLEATRLIRSQGLNTETAILAMTASIAVSDKMLCVEAGCNDYISKPIKRDTFLRKIEQFIKKKEYIENAKCGGDITSMFGDNTDYRKTVELFVSNLPSRIEEMQQALETGNLNDLALKAHALKGLGGFAGFPIFTEKAKDLELLIKDNNIAKIREQLDEIITLCLRTRLTHK